MKEQIKTNPALRTLISVIAAALLVIGSIFVFWNIFSHSLTRLEENAATNPSLLPPNPFTQKLAGEEEGRINVLILGISGDGYISGELTDSIIVASINPTQGNGSLIGLPRDLWVETPDTSFMKINELYSLGGGTQEPDASKAQLMREKVEQITGIPMHYVLVVDLDATSAAVEVIGGLTIDGVSYSAEEINRFVRDRSTAGGDFDRMRRQQQVILGVLRAMRGSDPQTLISLYGVLSGHVSTSAHATEMLRFFEIGKSVDAERVSFHVITPQTDGLLKSQYHDVAGRNIYTIEPTAGATDYTAITAYISGILEGS